jgi:hypothetical protein
MAMAFPPEIRMRLALCLFALPALIPLALTLPAHANDGFGGLSATGLTFGQTDAVAMVEEDLYISLDRISVDYVFRNTTAQDVTGEVIFPLPPVFVWSGWYGMMNLPEDLSSPDLVNFTVTVDGRPITPAIDRIAVIEEPWDEARPPSAQYDTPGRDITADLERHGIPITLDATRINEILRAGRVPRGRPGHRLPGRGLCAMVGRDALSLDPDLPRRQGSGGQPQLRQPPPGRAVLLGASPRRL